MIFMNFSMKEGNIFTKVFPIQIRGSEIIQNGGLGMALFIDFIMLSMLQRLLNSRNNEDIFFYLKAFQEISK